MQRAFSIFLILGLVACSSPKDEVWSAAQKTFDAGAALPATRQDESKWKERGKVGVVELGVEIVRIDQNGHPVVAITATRADGTKEKFYSEARDSAELAGTILGAAAAVLAMPDCDKRPIGGDMRACP